MKSQEQAVQDSVAQNYETLRYRLAHAKHYHDWWIKEMLAMADPATLKGTILDDGCGIGILASYLDPSAAVIGVDLSVNMLRAASPSTHLDRVQGDSTSLPFPNSRFDLVLARSLLHHLPDPEIGVREAYRVLRPGGQAIFADTNRSILSTLPRRIAYRSEHFSDDHQNFRRDDYLGWLRDRFQIQRVRYFGYLAYPFGFPDMMGRLRSVKLPIRILDGLIRLDNGLARIPLVRSQSWGIMVAARKI